MVASRIEGSHRIRQSKGDVVFTIIRSIIIFFAFVVVAYPLIYILSSSLSSATAVQRGVVWLFPVDFSLDGYKEVFKNKDIFMGYSNTILYTVLGTTLSVCVTISAAFALTRKEMPGRNVILMLFTFTMLFSGGIIPLYLVVKNTIGVNNILCMILPNAISIWNLILAKTFLASSIPEELYEAATVDGCSYFGYFFKIVLPLSKSIVAIMVLLFALSNWNSFFYGFVFLTSKRLYPLQIILRNILVVNDSMLDQVGNMQAASRAAAMQELLKYSLIVVASLPVLILYPFVQKYFVKGLMIGSVKG